MQNVNANVNFYIPDSIARTKRRQVVFSFEDNLDALISKYVRPCSQTNPPHSLVHCCALARVKRRRKHSAFILHNISHVSLGTLLAQHPLYSPCACY